jgi:hypothetical protein
MSSQGKQGTIDQCLVDIILHRSGIQVWSSV